jgi:flagellar biosynthesis component FlhA
MALKNFEERLVNARKEKGFTQEEFALRLGVTPQAVSRWERGIGYPDMELLYYICEILDCSADYLLQRMNKLPLTENNDKNQEVQLLYDILAEPIVLEVGAAWITCLKEEGKNQFAHIKELRKKLASKYGVLLPVIRIRDSLDLCENEFRIMAYDIILYSDIAIPENLSLNHITSKVENITFDQYDKILNRQMVQVLVDNVAENYPAVVKGVIPDKISLMLLHNILSRLVLLRKSIRNLVKIIEVLEEEIENTGNKDELTDILIKRLQL